MSSLACTVSFGLLTHLTPIPIQSPPPLRTPATSDPRLIASGNAAIADFDLDGVADVVVTNGFLQAVSGPFMLLKLDETGASVGRETGPMTPSLLGIYKTSVALDVDRDGMADLLTLNSNGLLEFFANGGPARLRATGQRFHDAILVDDLAVNLIGSRNFTFSVMFAADIDQDGEQDLVVSGQLHRLFAEPVSTGLSVYFGGRGGLFTARSHTPGAIALAGRAADFDGNGVLEIVLLGDDGKLHHYPVVGRQLIPTIPHILPWAWPIVHMDVGDVDRDGIPDYVFAGDPGDPKLCVMTGTRTARPGKYISLTTPKGAAPDEITAVRLFDLDGDGKLDVVVLQAFGTTADARLLWHRGRGDGTFETPGHVTLPGKLNLMKGVALHDTLSAVDLDRDGNPELVVTTLIPVASAPAHVAVFPNWSRANSLVEHIGTGATGSGGFRPRIGAAGGAPCDGQADFAVTLTEAAGGAGRAALMCGVRPLEATIGGELTFYTAPRFVSLHQIRGFGAGGGFAIAPCPIPQDRTIVGLSFWFQWVIADSGPGRAIPLTTSDALRVVVGQR
jgi:hypothetical protein